MKAFERTRNEIRIESHRNDTREETKPIELNALDMQRQIDTQRYTGKYHTVLNE